MLRWFVRDLDIRSSLIATTVQEPAGGPRRRQVEVEDHGILQSDAAGRTAVRDRDMRQRAGRANRDAELSARTWAAPNFQSPRAIRCRLLHSARGLLHVAVRPLKPDEPSGTQLVLVHDMSFIERRNEETRRYLFYFFLALGAQHRPHHGGDCPAVVARLGAGAARAAAWRDHSRPGGVHRAGVAPDRPRPARTHSRSRTAIPSARRQPTHLGPAGAASDAAQRAARQ